MRILITNTQMRERSGTTIFARDLTLELLLIGHEVAIFTLVAGEIAGELRKEGVQVETSLHKIRMVPDIIHAHHVPLTIAALRYFKNVPAIYICHNHCLAIEAAPLHPRIQAYFGVSRICLKRVRACGVPKEKIHPIYNSVDLKRFQPRTTYLPERPRRALLFSNYASNTTHMPAVREACRLANIELDVIGLGSGNPCVAPEHILRKYDLVFAKAKAAIEAMATGAAVVLCDFSGAGPMVTSSEFTALKQVNFGFQALLNPLDPAVLGQEICRYDPADAKKVQNMARNEHSLDRMAAHLVNFYQHAVRTNSLKEENDPRISFFERTKDAAVLLLMRIHFSSTGRSCRSFFRKLPGISQARKTYWRFVKTG